MIYYIQDEEGNLIGFKYNNTLYYYIKNMQEDIIGITDSNYNLLCSYEYDSWGKLISIKDNNGNIITNTSHIGYINPFRYRSYYYDNETKLYYLNSRYYNPEWGRFINGDNILIQNKWLCGNNLYLYCNNSPTNFHDYTGRYISPILPASELYNFSYTVVCTTNEDEYRIAITIENKIYIATLSQEAYSFTFSLNPDFEPKYSYTLSTAMTEIFETIYDKKMEGRTITGIEAELNIHKSAYDITGNSRVDTANIGTNKNDSNAWMFEVIDNFALKSPLRMMFGNKTKNKKKDKKTKSKNFLEKLLDFIFIA